MEYVEFFLICIRLQTRRQRGHCPRNKKICSCGKEERLSLSLLSATSKSEAVPNSLIDLIPGELRDSDEVLPLTFLIYPPTLSATELRLEEF